MARPRSSTSVREKGRRRQWRRWLLLFVVIAAVIGASKACSYYTGRTNPVDVLITNVTAPLIGVPHAIAQGFRSLLSIPSALRENANLRAENAYLERRLAELKYFEQENLQLEALLKLPPQPGFRPVAARVIARPYDLWLESALISAGSEDDVRKGNLVANDLGVVGIISETHASYSRITLISSPRFVLGGVTRGAGRQRVEGVIKGVDARALKLDSVPVGAPVATGDKVFTIGEETQPGGQNNRPRGLYVGMIGVKGTDRSGFTAYTIEPAASANRLGRLVVYTR